MGLQNAMQSRSAEENIANYAFMNNLPNKFELTPWEHISNGDMFSITALKWIPDIFWSE